MAANMRTVRLDLSLPLYNPLEYWALDKDKGVYDLLREIVTQWVDNNPIPKEDEP